MKMILLFAALAMVTLVAMANFDLGDLPACYPTFYANPGHTMSGKAWLGATITAEDEPYPVNGDPGDDGVAFLNGPWTPCTMVQVTINVHAGPNFDGQDLYINGWKDGNLDGDFCDTLCDGLANEWIVQDQLVTPGDITFTFEDPGVTDMGAYPGVFRWRLTGRAIGREGFGFYNPFDCPESPVCGSFLADSMGEVEDYWMEDFQLQVTLNGFDAIPGDNQVTVAWRTASETNNDHFEIMRNGRLIQTVAGAGNSSSDLSYNWVDLTAVNGTSYTYALESVDAAGHRSVLASDNAVPSAAQAVVTEYALRQNYPNPFNPSTSITFDLLEQGNASLKVYNMMGQEVATLVNGILASGRHTVNFDATGLPSGLYLYRLETNGFTDQHKMLLIK